RSEPDYGGRKLSQWVLELPPNVSESGKSAAEVALRNIGTNALPYLLRGPGVTRATSYSGVDAFSLVYQTDGTPVLTVSHTNSLPVPPAGLKGAENAPGPGNTLKK